MVGIGAGLVADAAVVKVHGLAFEGAVGGGGCSGGVGDADGLLMAILWYLLCKAGLLFRVKLTYYLCVMLRLNRHSQAQHNHYTQHQLLSLITSPHPYANFFLQLHWVDYRTGTDIFCF